MACAALAACGPSPSRTPLGGNYAALEDASPRKLQPAPEAQAAASDGGGEGEPVAKPSAPVAIAPIKAESGLRADSGDAVRYEPLKSGDQIRADVSFGIAAEVQGNLPDPHGSNKLSLDAKLHVELKVVRGSAQGLDQLEVTLTPVSLHTDFDGHSSDTKQDPPQTYDVTLSGQTPSIRARGGAPLEKEDRAMLTVLITPLVEFHNRWSRAPTFDAKAGWSSKIPLATPSFMTAPGDTVKVGPLAVRYGGRDATPANTPFELSLPIEWTTDIGRLNLELGGRAELGPKGRPVSLNLSGPLSGNAGAPGMQFALRGNARFAVALSYP
jgi:hypothetical protein